jgi:glycosyltransferase involved in cell wall biosynthesis
VDLKRFKPGARKENPVPVVALVARMLRDKGIYEFVDAAHRLHAQSVKARFLLVGTPDPLNPASISEEVLNAWHGRNGVEWLRWHEDIPQLMANTDVACLPSYREGLPKSLIEAAACGVPIVTTDTPGCREVVRHGDNGFLVPVRSVSELSDALKQLVQNYQLRVRMGRRGAEIAEQEFSSERVVTETLEVYRKLLMSDPDC